MAGLLAKAKFTELLMLNLGANWPVTALQSKQANEMPSMGK
jgi:hypothetical protein